MAEEKKEVKKFSAETGDKVLIETVDAWIKESLSYHDVLLRQQNRSLRYYRGNQTDRDLIQPFNSNTVHNRIFEGTETLVPIITGTAHQFTALPGNDSEESLMLSQKVQAMLSRVYETLGIQGKLEEAVRDIILKRFGLLEWFWDKEIDDVGVRVLDPRTVLIPKLKVPPEQLPYVIKVIDMTIEDVEENFPDFDLAELTKEKKVETTGITSTIPPITFSANREGLGDEDLVTYQIFEVWTAETVVWKHSTHILKKIANPYWDFEGEEQERVGGKKFFNHLEKPTIPIVFLAPFRTGEGPVSPTSLTEIAIPIQDDINTQKRGIINNLLKMGNGQIYIDKGAMEQELVDQITNEAGLKIVGDGIASENRIRREPGVPLPAAHFNNLINSMQSFDSIFGVQPAVRGESQASTLGGQILNKEQNLSRIDLITREVNRGVAHLADGLIQMMKMFYTEQKVLKYLGADDGVIFLRFSREDIQDNIVIDVKSGQTPQLDPVQLGNRAIQLWQLGAIDPVTLFKTLGMPNPEDLAKRLQAWKLNQLLQETNARIAEADAGAEAKAAEGASPGSSRKVETAANSKQRAEQGGTANAEKPKGTPKTSNN